MPESIALLNLNHKHRCSTWNDDGQMHVGTRLKALMVAQGISTERMAEFAGVTPGAVSNWFSTGKITRDNLLAAADLVGESVRYLITGDEADRDFSAIEAEWARRAVPAHVHETILVMLRSLPLREGASAPPALRPVSIAPPAPPAPADPGAQEYAAALRSGTAALPPSNKARRKG